MKHIILGFIAFIHHNKYVQMTITGTHQYTMYHGMQVLLDVSQCSYNSYLLILHLSKFAIKRSTIYSDRFPYSSNLLDK